MIIVRAMNQKKLNINKFGSYENTSIYSQCLTLIKRIINNLQACIENSLYPGPRHQRQPHNQKRGKIRNHF